MGGGSKGGGGSASGKVDYPKYMKVTHAQWLKGDTGDLIPEAIDIADEYSMAGLIKTRVSGDDHNPYLELISEDPDVYASIEAIDPSTYITDPGLYSTVWNAMHTTAKTKADALFDASIASEYAAMEDRQEETLLRGINRLSSGMAEIGAINSSAYLLGLSMLEQQHSRTMAAVSAELSLRKIDFISNAVAQLHTMLTTSIDTGRMRWLAAQEYQTQQLEYNVRSEMYPMELYQYGANLLAAISGANMGAGPMEKAPSKTMSALSGAMAGAAAGTAINPGYGTAIGAVAGGLMGYMAAS
jgi:hypothetical protein